MQFIKTFKLTSFVAKCFQLLIKTQLVLVNKINIFLVLAFLWAIITTMIIQKYLSKFEKIYLIVEISVDY